MWSSSVSLEDDLTRMPIGAFPAQLQVQLGGKLRAPPPSSASLLPDERIRRVSRPVLAGDLIVGLTSRTRETAVCTVRGLHLLCVSSLAMGPSFGNRSKPKCRQHILASGDIYSRRQRTPSKISPGDKRKCSCTCSCSRLAWRTS